MLFIENNWIIARLSYKQVMKTNRCHQVVVVRWWMLLTEIRVLTIDN
ncbi:MAG: hypothetical protein J6T00_04255 [Bacteroidaceae bacterium]|nr:hypothetical protein [Bacteroidaceae bacterium]